MEQLLKVFIYAEGEKPIFHEPTDPILKGIYASEGWFMRHMENNKQFVVKDPIKAHLFYFPFSSRMLQLQLYVRNSHSRQNLADYVKNYVHMIATKYPFWNRTGGADHFVVACHDWVSQVQSKKLFRLLSLSIFPNWLGICRLHLRQGGIWIIASKSSAMPTLLEISK